MRTPPHLRFAILLISATGIAYQITLMRIFAIAQWHHFAYMIISIAMLGFGASGATLALMRNMLRGRETAAIRWVAWTAAASLSLCYAISQRIPFETLQLTTQPGQIGLLLLLYLVLAIPFFLLASCITLAFFIAQHEIGRLYGFDMLGSGIGGISTMFALYLVYPADMPAVLTAVAVCAAFLLHLGGGRRLAATGALFALAITGVALASRAEIRVSEYKDLSYTLSYPDARIVGHATSPIATLTAVESEMIRKTPGQLALNYPMSELGSLPRQIAVYFDGAGETAVNDLGAGLEKFAYLDYVTGAVAYRLVDKPRVLAIGAGGGTDIVSALYHGAQSVTAVELDPRVAPLLQEQLPPEFALLYQRDDVTHVVAEGRGYLEGSDNRYDLIGLPLFGSFNTAASGVFALNESYLYTVEAFSLFLDRLTDNGIIVLESWLKTPPRDAIKLFATAVEALEARGVADPGGHIAFIRSWNNATIVIAARPLTNDQVDAIRDFCSDRGFDLCHVPGIRAEEANRFAVLERPLYFEAAQAILSENREDFYARYLFEVRPAADNRPYFFRFFKWAGLRELVRATGDQWLLFIEEGYAVLVATVLQAAITSVVLILLPLFVMAREKGLPRRWVFVYFTALGGAYMFLEIAFIQIMMRFLAYPVYAVAVVLTAFLVFSGLGSLYAGRSRIDSARLTRHAAIFISIVALTYIFVLPFVFRAGAGWLDAAKILTTIALLAPLSFCMGIPMPVGLQRTADRNQRLLAWAWGINGCASVLGATLATVCSVHFGFRIVVLLACCLYGVAAVTVRKL